MASGLKFYLEGEPKSKLLGTALTNYIELHSHVRKGEVSAQMTVTFHLSRLVLRCSDVVFLFLLGRTSPRLKETHRRPLTAALLTAATGHQQCDSFAHRV